MSFKANGGKFDIQGEEKEEYNIALIRGKSVKGTNIPEPSREGYRFSGWSFDALGNVDYDFTKPVTSDETIIYAKWLQRPIETITTESLASGIKGVEYNAVFEATGDGPIKWSVVKGSLPAGLSLSEDGKITGTPTDGGSYTFTVKAANEQSSAEKEFTINVYYVVAVKVSPLDNGLVEIKSESGKWAKELNLNRLGGDESVCAKPNEGYKFKHWENADGDVVSTANPYSFTLNDNIALVAVFEEKTYSVTIANSITGGTVSVDKMSDIHEGEVVTLTAVPNEGYELSELMVKDERNESIAVTDSKFTMPAGDVSVEASFKKKIVNVTFNANGGKFEGDKETLEKSVEYGETVSANGLLTPSREGYVFDGWYVDAAGETAFDFSKPMKSDETIVYAKWAFDYVSVSFKANGGKFDIQGEEKEEYNIALIRGKSVGSTEIPEPSREGYRFSGWYEDTTCNIAFSFDKAISADETAVYAKWLQRPVETITTETLASGIKGVEYNASLEATGDGPIKWSVVKGSLPAGLSLSEDGKITGTPTDGGSYTFTVKAANEQSSAEKEFTINVYYSIAVEVNPANNGLVEIKSESGKWAKEVDVNRIGGEESVCAKPNEGYKFKHWENADGDVVSTANPYSFTLGDNTKLVAVFEEKTYSVTIADSITGGTVSADRTSDIHEGEVVTLTAVPGEGYELSELMVKAEGNESIAVTDSKFTMPASNVSVSAAFKKKIINVTFNANGGKFEGDKETLEKSVEYGETVSANGLLTPSREGYKFNGWYEDAAGETAFDFSKPVKSDETIVYAKWTFDYVSVSFKANGGKFDIQGEEKEEYNISLIRGKSVKGTNIPEPSREGYRFSGWSFDALGNVDYDFTKPVTSDETIIYAKWLQRPVETITTESLASGIKGVEYNASLEATGDGPIKWSVTRGNLPAGLSLSDDGKIIGTPTEGGSYTFTVKAANEQSSAEKEFTIDIYYSIAVKVSPANSGLVEIKSESEKWAKELNLNRLGGEESVCAKPNEGYKFKHWTDGNDNVVSTANPYSFTLNDNTTLVAVFEEKTYSVTIANSITGGTVSVDKMSDIHEGEVVTLTAVPNEGYELSELMVKDERNESIAVTDSKFTMPAGDVSVSAAFKKKIVNVTFNANGGKFEGDKETLEKRVEYGETVSANGLLTPSREGYKFDGWYSDEACKTPFDFSKPMKSDDTTIYAKWEVDYITVSFKANGGKFDINGNKKEEYNISLIRGKSVGSTEIPEPSREGYRFSGWSFDALGNVDYDFTKPIAGDVTIYAKWTVQNMQTTLNLTINTLDENEQAISEIGGTASLSKTEVFVGDKINVSVQPNEGYELFRVSYGEVVFYTDPADALSFTVSKDSFDNVIDYVTVVFIKKNESAIIDWKTTPPDEWNGTGGLLFVAEERGNIDTSFENFEGITMDGEEVYNANYTVVKGSVILTLKESYLKTLTDGEHTLAMMFKGDIILETKFNVKGGAKSKHKIAWKPGKGEGTEIIDNVFEDDEINVKPFPESWKVPSGMHFICWNVTDSAVNDEQYIKDTYKVAGDAAFTANYGYWITGWEDTGAGGVDKEGGGVGDAALTYAEQNAQIAYVAGDKIGLDIYLKDGYILRNGEVNVVGVVSNKVFATVNLTYESDKNKYYVKTENGFVMPEEDVKLQFATDLKTVTVTFDANGGKFEGNKTSINQPFVKGNKATEPEEPKLDGYKFEGWYVDAAGETAFDFSKQVTKDIVIFAKWTKEAEEPVEYTLFEGSDSWTLDSSEPLKLVINRSVDNENCFERFIGVQIDDEVLVRGIDYDAESGSTIITIKAAVLNKLGAGDHKIIAKFDDGNVEIPFKVLAAQSTGAGGSQSGGGSGGTQTGGGSQVGGEGSAEGGNNIPSGFISREETQTIGINMDEMQISGESNTEGVKNDTINPAGKGNSKNESGAPVTGDSGNNWLWIALFAAVIGLLGMAGIYGERRKVRR